MGERLKQEDELHRAIADAIETRLRVGAPGIVRSFDPEKQTAEIQLAIREKMRMETGVFPLMDKDLPLLVDVRVGIPRAGGFMLTLPVASGDECWVFFADSCIDAWFQSGGVQNQVFKRRHSLADAFAVPMAWSQPRAISEYSSTSLQIRNEAGTAFIDLSPTALTLSFAGKTIVIDATGVTIEGKAFLPHRHTGVQAGPDQTGGVA
jgi:hypothetical protein